MKSLTPNIFAKDLNATVKWYSLLGFEVVATVPEDSPEFIWVMMKVGNVKIMFQSFESIKGELSSISREPGGSLLLYIEVEDIEDLLDEIKDKVEVIRPLETTFYDAVEFSILDPNGYMLTFAEMKNR